MGFSTLRAFTSALYALAPVKLPGTKALPLWQLMHASRPDESVVLRISCWILANVG